VTTKRDNLCGTITNVGSVLEIKHNHKDDELYNFEIVAILEKDIALFNFYLYLNLNVNAIL